jgi:hypothetical protein
MLKREGWRVSACAERAGAPRGSDRAVSERDGQRGSLLLGPGLDDLLNTDGSSGMTTDTTGVPQPALDDPHLRSHWLGG